MGTTSKDTVAGGMNSDLHSRLLIAIGSIMLSVAIVPMVCIIGLGVLWHYIDPITPRVAALVHSYMTPMYEWIVRKKEDAFLCNWLILQAIFVPLLFAYNFYLAVTTGSLSLPMVISYHVLRMGPYFINFAYAYTLCHKEGHVSGLGIFKQPYGNFGLRNAWNWWIGMFYGVMPSNFAYGHTRNHHRYNSDEGDVISTWDRPRDSFINYVRFLPRFTGYALNITPIFQFYKDKNYSYVVKMMGGSIFYWTIFAFFAKKHTLFALVYLGYPLLEAAVLLGAIQWAWHSFLDPVTDNVFANSVTLFGGDYKTNILNEDYHVVHHQYPGAHWSTHPKLFEKHRQEYITNRATCFNDTHAMEIFFLSILKQYDVFADKFLDLSGEMTKEQKRELIKTRLQTCSWGPYQNGGPDGEVPVAKEAKEGKEGKAE